MQSYRTPVYYVDLTLRDGTNLQEAIQTAKEIDQKSKLCGFNQVALDQIARHGFSNAQFEVNTEEGLDLVEEFYTEESSKAKTKHKLNQDDGFVQDMQKGLQGSVRAVN
jgi:hypothetical protein